MKLNVLLFGITRDIVGQSQLELEYNGEANVAAFKQMLVNQYPKMDQLAHFKVAVNQEFASDEHSLQTGDEIALIPPVSGG